MPSRSGASRTHRLLHALSPREYPLAFTALAFLLIGAALWLFPDTRGASDPVWLAGLVLAGAPLVWRTARGVLAGHFAADLVAALAIVAAVLLDHPFAGLVIVLMQSGGEALERYAAGRASEAVRALEAAAPRLAHLVAPDGTVRDVAADEVNVGDLLLVRPGELVPCDGEVTIGRSHVDTSKLTGEPMPVTAVPGTRLLSGSANGEGPLTLRALARAHESQYARIVELVRTAQATKAPLQRLADRYAVWFTPITLAVCAIAYVATGDASRVLAVLVVATPCPLILATPVAIIGGINRAARRQIIVRHGAALEELGRVTAAAFDKTGTLTIGAPRVSALVVAPAFDERTVYRLVGAVERGASHLLARAVEEAVAAAGVRAPAASHVTESAGRGVIGVVEGRVVTVGSRGFLHERHPRSTEQFAEIDGEAGGGGGGGADGGGNGHGLRSYVAVDGSAAAIIEFADQLRPGLDRLFAELARCGLRRMVLLSGDHEANAQAVARALGITEVRGDLLPEDKVAAVDRLSHAGHHAMAVGDGTNDAPMLSRASVGVALAARGGGGITAEAADVVLLADDVTRVAEAVRIGRRTMRIAKQSIWAGLGLSGAAMVVAALGYIPPTVGALLQEAVDVAVILNALRASAAGRGTRDVVSGKR